MSLVLLAPWWWHSKIAGGARHSAQSDTTGPSRSTVRLPLINTVTQRQKWGLGQDTSCYFRSFEFAGASICSSLCLSPSLLGNSQKQSETHWNLARTFIFLFARSQPLVCQKGIRREKKSLAEQIHLFIPPLFPASRPKLSPSVRQGSSFFSQS